MKRREFIAAATAACLLPKYASAQSPLRDIQVTRVIGFDVVSKRPKLVGKNSRLGVHGDRATDRMLRIQTNQGVEGIGNCRASKEAASVLLGKNPLDLFQRDERRMTGPLGVGTMPLWDLAGKVLGEPAFELLGGKGPQQVPVYDGSIYFADLLPQYADNWQARFREEIDMGIKRGHRAFKIKIGRGNRWMDRQEGDDRDVAVVQLIRQHAGDDVVLGVDANNGYDLAGAKQFFERAGDTNIAFAEEMFPEMVEHCLQFKEFLRDAGYRTLVADGETQGDLDVFKPFIKAKAIEIYQADMNRFGLEGILTEAAWTAKQDLLIAPHNWGSLIGYYMQLHIGRAITNFYRAENDPLDNDVLIADGYTIKDGIATVPDKPGFGLTINEEKFASDVKVLFDEKM